MIEPVDPSNPNQVGNLPFADALARTMPLSGSAAAGIAIFKARSRNACHTSTAGQKPIGAHLAEIGKRYKANELIESILKPSEKIARGYETQMILLDSGQVVAKVVKTFGIGAPPKLLTSSATTVIYRAMLSLALS